MEPTPPKFNIAPEKWWLEDYFPIEKGFMEPKYFAEEVIGHPNHHLRI